MFPALLFLLTTAFYMVTSYPVLATGDSGEFITGACRLGISHPPSFPLFSLIGKAFSILPLANDGWRVTLGVVLFSSCAAVLLFFIVRLLSRSNAAALIAALSYAFCPVVWSQAIIAEVYALNVCFLLACCFLLLRWKETGTPAYLYAFGLTFGLSLTNHYPLMLLALPAYVLFIIINIRSLRWNNVPVVLGFAVLGLLVYLYLPIRSGKNPVLDWGNPETAANFLNTVFRRQYRLVELTRQVSSGDKLRFVLQFCGEAARQFHVLLVPLLWGGYALFKQRKDVFWMSLCILACNSLGLILMLHFPFNPERVGIVEVYYLPSFAMGALWLGMGIRAAIDCIQPLKPAARTAALCVLFVLLAGADAATLAVGFRSNFQRNNFLAYDYGKNILSFLPKDSLLFIENAGDEALFSTLFLHGVRGVRSDLRVMDCFGNVFTNVYGDDVTLMTDKAAWVNRRKAVENRMIAATASPVNYMTLASEGVVPMSPRNGLVTPVVRGAGRSDSDDDRWALYNLRGLDNDRYNDYQERQIIGVYYFFLGSDLLARHRQKAGYACFETAVQKSFDVLWVMNQTGLAYYRNGLPEQAIRVFSSLLAHYPGSSTDWYNQGLAYRALQRRDDALRSFTAATALDPGDQDSFKEMADLLWESGKKDEATGILRSKLRGNTSIAGSYMRSGAELYKQRQPVRALDEWQKALLVSPDLAMAYYNRGVVYNELGRYDESRQALQSFLDLQPDGPLSGAVRATLRRTGR